MAKETGMYATGVPEDVISRPPFISGTTEEHIFDLYVTAPEQLMRGAVIAYQKWAVSRSSLVQRLGCPPDFEAVRPIAKSKSVAAGPRASIASLPE